MSAFARQIRAGFSAIMPVAAPGMPSVTWVEQAFGLTLYAAQRSAIFAPERYAIIEASTKSGKTVGSLIWLTERVLQGRPGQNFWWVAPIRDQAKLAFRRLKRALPPGHYLANESELTVTLDDRVLWFKGGDHPDSLYGEDVYAAVIDEASRLKEEAWHAVRSTLTATRGPVRMIGNVKGRKNWFYKLARTAESGADLTMHYAKITAHDAVRAGILDADEIADARQKLPGAVYRELYEAEPSDDQGNPFGLDAIRACLAPGLSAAAPVVWGWDLAKSVDFTVGIALDGAGRVCRFERFQKPWREIIETIQRVTGATPAIVDASGVGDPIVETLQRATETVKTSEGREEIVPRFGRFEAFKFTSASKQALMEGLAVAIQQKHITFPAGPIQAELEAFEYVYERTGVRYSAPSGLHDDCVMALALAVARWQKVDRHTGDDWMRLLTAGARKRTTPDTDTSDAYEDDERPVF